MINKIGFGSGFRKIGFRSSVFDPDAEMQLLFEGGEQGTFYNPSDLSTMFQDAAGTKPVTADGDPVGLIGDKSGNDNHATQAVSAARPIYKTDGALYRLQFDGVDDSLETQGDIFRNSKAGYVAATLKIGSLSGQQVILDYTVAVGATQNLIVIYTSGSKLFIGGRRLESDSLQSFELTVVKMGDTVTLDAYFDWQSGMLHYSFNGVDSSVVFQTAGLTDNTIRAVRIGTKYNLTGQYFKGSIYGIVVLDNEINLADRKKVRTYLANKVGVTL